MNKYDKERALCAENIEKCDKQLAIWRKRKSEWIARMENADKDEKLSLVAKSGYDDPDKLAERLGVKRDEETDANSPKEKHNEHNGYENAHNTNQNNTGSEKENFL